MYKIAPIVALTAALTSPIAAQEKIHQGVLEGIVKTEKNSPIERIVNLRTSDGRLGATIYDEGADGFNGNDRLVVERKNQPNYTLARNPQTGLMGLTRGEGDTASYVEFNDLGSQQIQENIDLFYGNLDQIEKPPQRGLYDSITAIGPLVPQIAQLMQGKAIPIEKKQKLFEAAIPYAQTILETLYVDKSNKPFGERFADQIANELQEADKYLGQQQK